MQVGAPGYADAGGTGRGGGSLCGLWSEKDPPDRRRTPSTVGHRGVMPAAADLAGLGGTVSHHQRKPSAGPGYSFAGGRSRPAEHQSGHFTAGKICPNDKTGAAFRRALRRPGGGGCGIPQSEIRHRPHRRLQ